MTDILQRGAERLAASYEPYNTALVKDIVADPGIRELVELAEWFARGPIAHESDYMISRGRHALRKWEHGND